MTVFSQIEEYFAKLPNKVHDTQKGIFGVTDISIFHQFCKKINLNKSDYFVDLGSGDGRVAIVASLFCETKGIEFDAELVEESKNHNEALNTSAEFLCTDYEEYDFSKTTVVFSFSDHPFSKNMITKLQEEFTGTLYIYEGIFLPENIKKGKTIWIGQTPIISYQFTQN
jgi:SAM-dependent methyltransferase